MKLRKNKKGFTLIEVLLIVVILGIIAAIAVPRLMSSRAEAQMISCRANVANINMAIEKYFYDHNAYPASLVGSGETALFAATADAELYFPDGPPICGATGNSTTYTMNLNHRAKCGYAGHGNIYGATN
jgi:prepilin-type N-terminal cleavage/methylation domain-containing protein